MSPSNVDLPEPDAPVMAKASPRRADRLTLSKMVMVPAESETCWHKFFTSKE